MNLKGFRDSITTITDTLCVSPEVLIEYCKVLDYCILSIPQNKNLIAAVTFHLFVKLVGFIPWIRLHTMIYLKHYFKIFITALNSAVIKIKHSLKKGLVFLPTLGKGIDLRTVSTTKILGITIGTASVLGFGKFLINKTFVKSAVGRYALPNLQKNI